MFEFLVDSISPEGLLLGRNRNGDIPIGTTFTSVRLNRVHQDDGEFWTEELGEVGSVAMTLQAVQWYHQTIEVAPGGHTAGLRVTGDGLAVLADQLGTLPAKHFLSLTAPAITDAEKNGQREPPITRILKS